MATLFLLCAADSFAQEVTVKADVDQTRITLGDQIVYTVIVSGSARSLPYPQLPDFKDFTVVSGPSTTQQTLIVNNQVSVSEIYTVLLQSRKVGQFTIAPAIVRYKDEEYKSRSITIDVQKELSGAIPAELSGENLISARTNNAELNRQLKGRLFLRTVISKAQPYVGEQISVSYYLYNDGLHLRNLGIVAPEPEHKDFLKEDTYSPRDLLWKETTLGNRKYKVALIKRVALVPTKTGTFTLDPLNLNAKIRVQTRTSSRRRPFDSFFDDPFRDSFFDDFFDRSSVTVSIPSAPREVEIQPLPSPQPANFTGTVGDYTISAETDRTEATEDDLITLRIKVSGTGYVDSVIDPKLPQLEGLEIYGSKATVNRTLKDEKIGGDKVFEYVLRPKRPGKRLIPPIEYTVFDAAEEKYDTLRTSEIALDVKPGKKQAPLIVASSQNESGSGKEVVQLGEEINYIKTTGLSLRPLPRMLYMQPGFIAFQAVPLLAMAVAYFIRRRRDMLEHNIALARTLAARGIVKKRLRSAARCLHSGDADKFCAELAGALRGFFGDKFNLPPAGLTTEGIAERLRARSIEEALCENTQRLLAQCDAARYAPGSIAQKEMEELYKEASTLIDSMAKKLG